VLEAQDNTCTRCSFQNLCTKDYEKYTLEEKVTFKKIGNCKNYERSDEKSVNYIYANFDFLVKPDTFLGKPFASKDEKKLDKGKLNYSLVPFEAYKWLAEVYTFGSTKYKENTWKEVEKERYYSAMFRHLQCFFEGIDFDKESNLHHLKHALWNMFAYTYLELEEDEIINKIKED
jgi:hypothetical protein